MSFFKVQVAERKADRIVCSSPQLAIPLHLAIIPRAHMLCWLACCLLLCHCLQPDTARDLSQLVRYVTEMPSASESEARRFKYPFVSSEILSCDINAVRDAIFAGRRWFFSSSHS